MSPEQVSWLCLLQSKLDATPGLSNILGDLNKPYKHEQMTFEFEVEAYRKMRWYKQHVSRTKHPSYRYLYFHTYCVSCVHTEQPHDANSVEQQ